LFEKFFNFQRNQRESQLQEIKVFRKKRKKKKNESYTLDFVAGVEGASFFSVTFRVGSK